MTSNTNFNKIMTEIEKLPEELERNLNLLKTLNARSKDITGKIDKYADRYFSNVKEYSEKEKRVTIDKMQRRFTDVKELGDAKVQLSIDTYKMVDKCIRNLDTNIAELEEKMKKKGYRTKF